MRSRWHWMWFMLLVGALLGGCGGTVDVDVVSRREPTSTPTWRVRSAGEPILSSVATAIPIPTRTPDAVPAPTLGVAAATMPTLAPSPTERSVVAPTSAPTSRVAPTTTPKPGAPVITTPTPQHGSAITPLAAAARAPTAAPAPTAAHNRTTAQAPMAEPTKAPEPTRPAGGKSQPAAAAPGNADNGKKLFNEPVIVSANAPGCLTCHSLEQGRTLVGPSLAGIATDAAGIVKEAGYRGTAKTGADWLRESILNPNADVPEGFMPDIMPWTFTELSAQELNDLVAYLQVLK